MGNLIALGGALLAVIFTGVAASIGLMWVQRAAAGVISEEPDRYGKLFALQLVPTSASLYGFVVAFVILGKTLLSGGTYTTDQGILVLLACLPIAIIGAVQTIFQSKICVACVHMVGKNGTLSGRALTMSVFSELFALFAFIISFMSIFFI